MPSGKRRGRGYILCPECGQPSNGVKDSRRNNKPPGIWRRRKCHICGEMFTTYEITERDFLRIRDAYLKYKRMVESAKNTKPIIEEQCDKQGSYCFNSERMDRHEGKEERVQADQGVVAGAG